MNESRARATTLSELGETGLLRQVFPRLSGSPSVVVGPGDDAAVVTAPDGAFVVTTDILVQDVDFRLDWSSGEDVGWKAAMQNLADVAAMGAAPTSVVVGLVAPGTTSAQWALDLTTGLAEGCRQFGAVVVGGDLSSGDAIVVSITAFGDLGGRLPVRRSGASVGDVVAVAGESGWSAAGLALLQAGCDDGTADLPQAGRQALARHRRPQPPVALGVVANDVGASAMIDTSDGLLRDLGRVASASGVTLRLEPEAFHDALGPLQSLAQWLGAQCGQPHDPLDWLLTGGEDHCLAATFPPETALPQGFRRIGSVLARGDREVEGFPDRSGGVAQSVGFDHFNPGQ